jgi:hypothetical protein
MTEFGREPPVRCSATALFLMPAVPAVARPEDPAAAGRSPFLGTWELDLSRMPANYGPPPRRVLYIFEDAGAGQWRTTVDITAADCKEMTESAASADPAGRPFVRNFHFRRLQ